MRLTLRTLLAYLDDILEPADHEDLGHKIETSDFATELIHRSRDVARRLRLGAPAIDAGAADVAAVGSAGRQSAGVRVADANVVAEYLDNTLPPEDLAEFERLCIEPSSKADMHLAEVVSCHHVLTMVLGEPAEIDHQLKERLYRLPADLASGKKLRIESAHVASPQVAPATATPATAQQSGSHSATTVLPDYLQAAAASRARGRRLLLAAATVLGLGVLAWLVTPMFLEPEVPADLIPAEMEMFTGEVLIEGEPLVILEESNLGANPATEIQVAQSAETAGPLLARPPTTPSGPVEDSVEEVPNTPAPTISPADDPVEPAPAALADVASPTAPAAEPTAAAETAEAASQVETAAPQDQPPAFEFAAPEVPASAGERSADDPAWSRENSPGGDGDIVFDASDALSAAGAVRADAGPLVTDSRELAAEDAGLVDARAEDADVGDADVASVDAIGAGPVATTDQAEPVAAEPVQVGNYLGNHDVLLRYDAPSQEWVRLPPRSPLFTDEVLLSLPKFRTHVVLEDINLYLSGGTQLGLLPATRAAAIELALDYGRALFIAGMQGNSMALQLGDQRRQFQLEGSASLAVEVRRVFVPGSDFSQQSPVEVVWYLTSGTVIWPNAAGQQQTIAAPAMWKTSAGIDDLPTEIMELPAWMDREPLTDSERRARDTLDAELPTGNSVALRMLELSSQNGLGRRREVRTLTAEACVYVGIFEPSVQALNDMALIRTWEVQIDTLRQAMARSPQVAEQVREAFVHQRGAAAAGDLMEMLGGYAIDALGDNRSARQTGALAKLIGWLEHDSLDYRVLAIHNLNEITGVYVPNQKRRTANLGGFKPNGPSQRRQIAVKKLWERLEAGDLLPQN